MRHPDYSPRRPLPGTHRRHACLVGAACLISIGLAQAAPADGPTSQPEDPVAFEAVRPGPASTVSRDAAPLPDKLPDMASLTSWAIPRIPWGGNTGSSYGWNSGSEGNKSYNETQTVNLRASSYIYQPWYAQVSGDVGLATSSSKQSGGTSTQSASRSTSMTYGGNLSLFPQSRFPFQAFVQTSDSRANANEASTQFNSVRMGAQQSYRPETGPETYSGSADRSIVTSSNIRSVVDALQGSFSTTINDHSLSTHARYSRNTGDISGQGSSVLSMGGTHSWRADEEFQVSSSANFTNSQISMLSATGLTVNESQIMQAGSSVTWLPDEDLPLTVNGGGNLLRINTATSTDKADLFNLSGYANANYRFSNNLNAVAGITLTQDMSSGNNRFSSGQTASVSYIGTPLIFGNYSYNWGTGGGVSNQIASNSGGNRNIFGQINHSLIREFILNEASAIALNASQGFSLTNNSIAGQSGVLTNAGGANWRLGYGDSILGNMSATVSDSLSVGNFPSHFRSLATQGNMQALLSSRSVLTTNVNFILSQQLSTTQITQTILPTAGTGTPTTTQTTNPGSNTLSGSGQIGYSHRSPFDISNLIYTATAQINASQTNLRLVTGDPNALAWQTGTVLLQNADYRLGRLVFRATGTIASMNGKKNASLFFTINREIGDF